MGDEGPVSSQHFFTPVGIDLDLHPELLRKKRMEKEVMIPLEILNSDSFVVQTLEFIEDRDVTGKDRRLLARNKIPETEEKFEKVPQDYQMANLLFL
jgi:hypothetical protein